MIKKIFFFFIFLFFSKVLLAQSINDNVCDKFYDQIRIKNSELELYNHPIWIQENAMYGFIIKSEYNEKDETWINTRDENNNISIFKTIYESDAYGKLFINDKIIYLNNQNTADLTDEEIDEIFDVNDEVKFEIKRENNELNNLYFDIKKKFFEQKTDVIPIFRIKSFQNIDIKNAEYTVNYDFDYYWYDDRLIELIKPLLEDEKGPMDKLIQEKKLKLKEDFNENTTVFGWYCDLTYEEFTKDQNLFLWHPEMEFVNLVKNDLENREVIVRFEYYIYGDGYENFFITIQDRGIATFFTRFNLKAFPFDSHVLEFIYADVKSSISAVSIDYDYYATLPLDENMKSKILEWNVPGNFAEYEAYTYYDKYNYEHDGIKTYFKIERNSTYYLFKVIAPIILILIVCWSVFWLRSDQIESRLTVSIVCLLTLIAYNFVIDENIPKLSYLTAMDQIILSSYFFASISTILSIYFAALNNKGNVNVLIIEKNIRIFGPLIYIFIVLSIMYLNINNNPSALGQMKAIFG